MELHPHEFKVLRVLNKKLSVDEIAKSSNLDRDAVNRALSWLYTKDLVKIEERIIEEVSLLNEGKEYIEKGLPERRILSIIGNEASIKEIQDKLRKDEIEIGLGWLRRKGLISLEKGRITVLSRKKTEDEKLLELLKKKTTLNSDDLDSELSRGLDMLRNRKRVVKISEKKMIFALPTKKGMELGRSMFRGSVSQLTPDMLISGEWKRKRFRRYDVNVYVKPQFPAKKHPLRRLIDQIRDIFVAMGFKEIKGPLIESAFWNFDSLFVPQDHPARDMHDTFYLENPEEIDIEDFERFKDVIKKTHENGWTTGSTGWGGKWNEGVARKALMRTHTTAVTCRYLTKLKREDLPVKVFCIGKTFRNEAIDYKHLPEFYQVEGIVVDENVNFRNLLGILKEFYDRMGFRIRFRPAYFPYTEMSVEPEVFLEEKGEWIELGGAGIFRPEVVKPLLGFDCPVLAWGLGLDRVAALNMGLNDIRDLYISDLNWLRNRSVL